MFNLHWETGITLFWLSLVESPSLYHACPSLYSMLMQLLSHLATHLLSMSPAASHKVPLANQAQALALVPIISHRPLRFTSGYFWLLAKSILRVFTGLSWPMFLLPLLLYTLDIVFVLS